MEQAAIWKFWGPLLTIAIVFAVRFRRAGRDRPLQMRRLWIVPTLVTAVILAAFIALPPPLSGWLALGGGVGVGAAVGWQRGKLVHIWKEPSGMLMHRTSPMVIMILLALFGLRFAVLHWAGGDPTGPHPVRAAVTLTDFLLGVAIGIVVFTRIEMYLRGSALLQRAKAQD